MERPIPMDRLLSGDVGFGKTEVAVRAAFKAIQDGKQVAMLVPTTLLVRQHIETFPSASPGSRCTCAPSAGSRPTRRRRRRSRGSPTAPSTSSSARTASSPSSIRFKDLGLVIIDEEQRFGVEHKDALKKLKTNVDILAMSATPIPRTLEMAVTGIREMSTLATPPEDRHPILTFVGPYYEQQVAAAIRRELLREGQVFFVHNRVSSINRVAAQLAELVPEARIAVAHGQLTEHVLEQVIVDFWERKFDVLVSTTIIETGLDIAEREHAHHRPRRQVRPVSQLHQLRGRVGRGRERAYAYFLYDETSRSPRPRTTGSTTIAANNELGSGMQVALKDLEIRGAGNLLGGEQSGHIAGVGFDLYLRMIGEAVSTSAATSPRGRPSCGSSCRSTRTSPRSTSTASGCGSRRTRSSRPRRRPPPRTEQIDQVLEELTDRYGEPPEAVQNLIAVSRLRRIGAAGRPRPRSSRWGRTCASRRADLADSLQVRLRAHVPGREALRAEPT